MFSKAIITGATGLVGRYVARCLVKNDVDEGFVVQEMQSGYTMHDRLLRPSMVGVSKKEEKKDIEEEKD